jgi:hypothetical protein
MFTPIDMTLKNSENKLGNWTEVPLAGVNPRIERLKKLLETVIANRLALKADRKSFMVEGFARELMKALAKRDRTRMASIVFEAKKAGFSEDDLKKAYGKIGK